MLQQNVCNTLFYVSKIHTHIHVQKRLWWIEAKQAPYAEAEMAHFLEIALGISYFRKEKYCATAARERSEKM